MPEHSGPRIDFGARADDYARFRPGFPASLFEELRAHGIGEPGQQVVDLGTGTGTLARGFARRGCRAIGIDPSAAMLAAAAQLARDAGVAVGWARGWAESIPVRDASCDVVCAGQCWHWFDRPRAAAEVARALRPGGRALIAGFSYLCEPGSLGAETEALVLRHHPDWDMAGGDGRSLQFLADLTGAGLQHLATLDSVVDVPFSHVGWRGRFRVCNGVLTLPAASVEAFDRELAALLAARYPEPVLAAHRVYALVAERSSA